MKTREILKVVLVGLSFAGGMIILGGSRSNEGGSVEAAAASRTLYRQHCAVCHGNDGRSNTPKGRETEASDLTSDDVRSMAHARIVRIISNGKGEMPRFKRKLSAGQIASIARYIKTL